MNSERFFSRAIGRPNEGSVLEVPCGVPGEFPEEGTAGLRRLSGQALATFGAAFSQYAAAIGGRHARAEAVPAFAHEVARLKCTFH